MAPDPSQATAENSVAAKASSLSHALLIAMARNYKRDKIGRFASGGGGQLSSGLSARKKEVTSGVSRDVLAGKKVSSSRKNYARAQNAAAADAAAKSAGKGNKAARRAAAPKPTAEQSSRARLLAIAERARAAGRKKGKAIASKTKARNKALDAKANAYGGRS
jgi:hypothetical protein